ncbi:DUF1203 domain-containing protein [Streptomyces fuscigenes]|uniref:DUF1203 domain-containing protein n=1 Tax=Streptomyces fuscigenes TaxID=1528880 RepID=UPI001F4877F1|nr:DUF1203 domain-containing protein [Streptomyces fuscigenes]MCF3965042.1 DUF1203 domain-containing protein [Streptomyces fuscigenes]
MTQHTPLAIPPAALAELRVTDDAGSVPAPFTDDEGGAPLRCCLRPSIPGETVALVTYAPLRRWAARTGARPGAYDEQGPVFVHPGECGGPGERRGGGYPFARPGALRTLRRYDARGHIDGGRLLEVTADADGGIDAALDEAFADPGVALVHVRAVEFGCFQFEVRRPGPPAAHRP